MKITYGVFFYFSIVLSVFANEQAPDFSLLPDHTMQPASLIDIAGSYPHVIISELSTGKLYVYKRQGDDTFVLLETMRTSIGKKGYGKTIEGDNKTPIGVYRITSHLTPEQLDDFYGNAAYPVNYPNAWDKINERTGYGIWLHAEPIGLTEKTRPLLDSNGCVVLSNNDIDIINQYVDVGYTYIIMTPKVQMVKVEDVTRLRKQLHERLKQWELSWESLSAEPYLAFYSEKFTNLEKNWEEWVSYKKRVNGNKSFIDVAISDLGIYRYPSEQDMVWVEYYQAYNSSNYKSGGWKRQLWEKEPDNVWRIIYEGGG
ncbi:MAG: murein L,D-transpeptidase YafK [Candidatus Endobugula sp.]|jgi:murein L,D-transpeptidase YafK